MYTCLRTSNTCFGIFVHIYAHTSQVVEASEQHHGEHQDIAPVGVPEEPSVHVAPDACHGQAAPLSAAARELGERRRVADARRAWRRRFEHISQPWSFERMRVQAFWLRTLNSELKRDLFLGLLRQVERVALDLPSRCNGCNGSGTGSGKGDGNVHTQSPKSQTKVLGSISEGPTCPPQSPPAKDSLVFISNISSHLIRVGLRQLL